MPPATEKIAALQDKGRWDKVIGTTPVVMTVVATILAGMSSGEMTRAQYHRALASQYQAKAADQWAFFQSKRERGTTRETMADALRALTLAGRIESADLEALAERLPQAFARAEQSARQVSEDVTKAREALGQAEARLRAAADRLLQAARNGAAESAALQKTAVRELARPEIQKALGYLNGDGLPNPGPRKTDDPLVEQGIAAIRDRKPESEVYALVLQIEPDVLQEAIEASEANAKAFDDASKPVDKATAAVESLVQKEVALAQACFQAARRVKWAITDLPPDAGKPVADLRSAADRLESHAVAVKTMVEEVNNGLLTARLGYTARRQEHEARDNQTSAYLYEIRVQQNSARSERHLRRSKNLFYGMLTAQLAVTISTLALAVRRRSFLWGMASLAGITAVFYGLSVYLDLFPFLIGRS